MNTIGSNFIDRWMEDNVPEQAASDIITVAKAAPNGLQAAAWAIVIGDGAPGYVQ
ncbi:hypothetical protein [Mesorhizobium sp. ES1-1]|uniref:hypothetical protein n=1 Tax=Mesorhizobium sp. ES1-1 TaxID=2876629 RepID=UPI001CCDD7AE|nr:hypothetical protein [Mesorhizobium sp. ES1-1]MBZ9677251.1 hypothetical protein [Mesorhizobium sp. ES1-1]